MKYKFFNDTQRPVKIHPASKIYGCTGDFSDIVPLEIRTFNLPPGSYPMTKLWDYGEELGLIILVSAEFD